MSFDSAVKLAVESLIKSFEGYHKALGNGCCEAYPDPATHREPWTIGWGSTVGVRQGDIWTKEQADDALYAEAVHSAAGLLKHSPNLATEPDYRVAALISFAYNCGLGNYRISTLRRRVNEKNWPEAAKEILKWNKAAGRIMPGLTRRRSAESALLR